MRAFGKDRARETKAPARSITAAVPTPLGPPVGCRPTPSDGIAYATSSTGCRKGKGFKMRGVELRDVTTAAGRALTQILLVGVAHLTYACQRTAVQPP